MTPTGSGSQTPGGTPAPPGSDPLAIKAATDLEALALRIGNEIQTEIPRATKPIALKERIAFCTSELEPLDKGIAALDATKLNRPARKTTLAATSEALRKGLVGAKAAGIRSANETLTAVIRSLNDQTAKFTEQLRSTRTDPKTLYKPISALLDTVTHEHTDWAAQVKEGSAYLGKDATALEIGVGKLGEIEAELNEMIGRCLPKLTSAPGKKPEGAVAAGGGDVVDDPIKVLVKLKDWSAAKQKYGSNPTEMQKLADIRKTLVNKWLMDELSRQSKLSGELIAARKGNLWMVAPEGGAPVDQDEQRRAYACDFMKKLGITSVAGLGKTYVDLGIRVNAAARKAIVA